MHMRFKDTTNGRVPQSTRGLLRMDATDREKVLYMPSAYDGTMQHASDTQMLLMPARMV